jgi:hypothetical protein
MDSFVGADCVECFLYVAPLPVSSGIQINHVVEEKPTENE